MNLLMILLMLQFKKFLNQLVLSMKLLKKIFQHLQQLPVQALLLFICSLMPWHVPVYCMVFLKIKPQQLLPKRFVLQLK